MISEGLRIHTHVKHQVRIIGNNVSVHKDSILVGVVADFALLTVEPSDPDLILRPADLDVHVFDLGWHFDVAGILDNHLGRLDCLQLLPHEIVAEADIGRWLVVETVILDIGLLRNCPGDAGHFRFQHGFGDLGVGFRTKIHAVSFRHGST